MKWVRYQVGDAVHYGIVDDSGIRQVRGTPFGPYEPDGTRHALADVRLLPPVMPQTFYAVGANYLAHAREANELLKRNDSIPKKPDVGYRASSALIAHDEPIVIPADSAGIIQFEGELVAVIGKTAKHVSEADALKYVLGYTIGNDVSERVWQAEDRTIWRAKNTDTFKPMGPWIETEVDLPSLVTRVRLNGKQVSQFNTNNMVFGVARFISEITKYVTMHPGDVLWMGAEAPTLDMRHGDVVEVEVGNIGVLRNSVVSERADARR
jgi:2-keto-4-pentenoate hydratase/2-oxohepta-3-ene-1,7-dioic acid hydratase in catechol pathway